MENNFFFKVKTYKVLTWRARAIVIVIASLVIWISSPLIRLGITKYIYKVDELQPDPRVIIENWNGQIDLFEEIAKVAQAAGANEIGSIIFEDVFNDPRKKHAYILNAAAAGIDTLHFFLIPTPRREPKTLNIARAVLDTAHRRSWTELTIVTFDLHSARTRKAYKYAAQPYGILIRVIGVPLEEINSTNWTTTSSGLAAAFSETIKKLYYDILVF